MRSGVRGRAFHLNSKIIEGVRKRVGERRAGADDAALSGAFDAEWIERRGRLFEYHAADVGDIRAGGQKIIHQTTGQELAIVIVNQFLQHRAADALDRRADGLAVNQ